MNLNIEKTIQKLSKFIPYPNIGSSEGVDYWKNRLLFTLILSLIFFGFIAYIPSVYVSIKEKIWSIVVVDSAVYGLIIFLGFSRRLSPKSKIIILLCTAYLLGTFLLVILGSEGAGFIWLFLFPVLAGLLLDMKAVLISNLITTITLGLLIIPIALQKPEGIGLHGYSVMIWLVNMVNFIAINFLISISISLIISRLNESLMKEKKISGLLKQEQEKLKMEKLHAEESDRLKSAFLANMSHEIRTPMNGILGFTELLRNPSIDGDKQNKYLNIIHESGERMLQILNDLIDISRIEADLIEFSIKRVHLNQLIIDIYRFFEPSAEAKNLNLSFATGLPDDHSIILTDGTKLTQIVSNLVSNALKFTETGFIEFGYILKEGDLEFYVRDSGIGIDKEMQDKIFERFLRVEENSNRSVAGAGLGLAISKAYIELMEGKIWMESESGKGSTFYLSLPYKVG